MLFDLVRRTHLTIVADEQTAAQAALSHAKTCVRTNYSNPPKHGAAIVDTVLGDDDLRSGWETELAAMRDRINQLLEVGTIQSVLFTEFVVQ